MGTYKFSIYLLLWENTLSGSFYNEVKKKLKVNNNNDNKKVSKLHNVITSKQRIK